MGKFLFRPMFNLLLCVFPYSYLVQTSVPYVRTTIKKLIEIGDQNEETCMKNRGESRGTHNMYDQYVGRLFSSIIFLHAFDGNATIKMDGMGLFCHQHLVIIKVLTR